MIVETEIHERINNWRVFPRLFSLFYLYWTGYVMDWFMMLDAPNNAQSAFAAAVVGAGAAWFKFYCDGGKK